MKTREQKVERARRRYKIYKESSPFKGSVAIGLMTGCVIGLFGISVTANEPLIITPPVSIEAYEQRNVDANKTEILELGSLIQVNTSTELELIEKGYLEPQAVAIKEEEPVAYNITSIDKDVYLYFYQKGEEFDIPGEILQAIAQKESGYNPNAISSTNDHGLMQINQSNFRYLRSKGIDNFYDPYQSIDAACYLLENIRKEVGERDWNLILMTYNMGPTKAKDMYQSGTTSTSYSREILSIADALRVKG